MVKVLGGPLNWQSAPGSTIRQMQPDVLEASLCDDQEDTFQHPEPEDEILDSSLHNSCYRVNAEESHSSSECLSHTFALPLPNMEKP